MLNNIVRNGDFIKLTENNDENIRKRQTNYKCRVVEVMGANRVKATMPVVNGRSVILDSLKRYTLEFITQKGMYQCEAKIVRRFKEKLNFFVVFEMMSELEKLQRREYYRLECVLEIKFRRSLEGNIYAKDEPENKVRRVIDEETGEELVLEKKVAPWHAAIATNISGGGVRFNSREALRKGELVMLKLHLKYDDGEDDFDLPAKVVYSSEVPERDDIFEARVQFLDITPQDRENIIRFVFDEERRIRRRKKGLV